MDIEEGKKVVIGPRKPDAVLPAKLANIQLKRGNATIREIVKAGTPFPPSKMFRYYGVNSNEAKYANLQEAKTFDRIVLQLEETETRQKKRRGQLVDTEKRMYTVLPRVLFDAFVYERRDI